jgi:adenylate cyclase
LLGRKGDVASDRLELRDAFVGALGAYRDQHWDAAETGFHQCLSIVPEDPASKVFLTRVAHFRDEPPGDDWNGVWALTSK